MNVSNKKLWEEVKKYVNENYREYGKWNAYKSAISVKMYKSRGGGYIGRKSNKNSLKKWLDEKWRYISVPKKTSRGGKSSRGRFLPDRVINKMSSSLKRYENRKKINSKSRKAKYSKRLNDIMKKNKIY